MCYSSQPPNVSTRGGPQVNKFDIGLQSGLPDVTSRRGGARALYGGGRLYSDVQYIMGNGHMGPPLRIERHN